MPEIETPSQIISTFLREVDRDFPDEQKQRVKTHESAVFVTTTEKDGHRARMCAVWAIEITEQKSPNHPRWNEIKELHEERRDAVFGVEFGVALHGPEGRLGPIADVEIQWTENSVLVARTLADEVGWSEVPWEELLISLITT